MKKTGLVHIYTGDGKGKTTAAIGLAIRARGAGLRVIVAQLFKKGSGEAKILKKIGVKHMEYSSKHPFFKRYSKEELELEAKQCTAFVRGVFNIVKSEEYDLVVLDEIGPALKFKLIKAEELANFIKSKPEKTELVMTGRGFLTQIIKLADYVTEMKMMSHPFDKGVSARKGIEY